MSALAELAAQWEKACRAGDAEAITALVAEDAVIWFNYQNKELDRAAYRALLDEGYRNFRNTKYHDFRVMLHENGFVEQATLESECDAGKISAPFLLITTVKNGKITRIDEYFDSATLQPVK
jgi:ketosteroid isomerase-like protein